MRNSLSTKLYKKYYELSDEQNGLVRKIFSRFPCLETYFLVEDIQEYVANELHKLESKRQSFSLGWIARVTQRCCIKLKDDIKKEMMTMQVFVDFSDKFEPPRPHFDINDRDTMTQHELFLYCKAICTEEEYIILYLRYRGDPKQEQEQGLSIQAIAKRLNMNENTVKSHLKRGKEKLQKQLKQTINY